MERFAGNSSPLTAYAIADINQNTINLE